MTAEALVTDPLLVGAPPLSAGPLGQGPEGPDDPASDYRNGPSLVLASLFLSLLGFLGVALLLYEFKFHHVTDYYHGLPTRVLFVVFVALAATPFYVTMFRRVPLPYLILPIGLVVFLYPIFSPSGLPYSHDPVYNYQFSQALLSSHTWQPLLGVTSQAKVYSYFPGGAVFNAEVASLTSVPEAETFSWSYDLLRLLVIPLGLYAMTARLFGSRCAPLAVLLYLTIPSTEMNVPTQQDFATVWFILVLVALAFLATSRETDTTGLRVVVIAASVVVILSHHVSTYLLVGFLLGLAVLPWLLKRHDPYPGAHSLSVLARTLTVAFVWIALVSLPVIEAQRSLLVANLQALVHPATPLAGTLTAPGQSYPIYELAWIGAAIVILVGLALLTLFELYPFERFGFVGFGLLTSVLVGLLALPFFSTGVSFLAFRVLEYAGVFFAPAAAWWLTRHLAVGRRKPPDPGPRPAPAGASRRRRRWVPVALAAILAFGLVAGGSMVPLSTRDQFSKVPSGVQVSSPLFVNQSAVAAAEWASTHLDPAESVWGDYLVYTVFGGFGHLAIAWDAYPAFATPTFNASLLHRLHVGQYVVTDSLMTERFSAPMFYGPGNDQPSGAIPAANLAKYDLPSDFAIVYENPVFTIYQIVQLPPVGA